MVKQHLKHFGLAIIKYSKHWVKAFLWQVPWFTCFSGIIWFLNTHLTNYISNAFNLSVYAKNAFLWQKRTEKIYESLSLTNPLSYTDYISALSASAFATAKETTIRQTVLFIGDILNSVLNFIWIIGCIYVVIRILRYHKIHTRNTEIANEVIARLLPILEEIKNNQHTDITPK